MEEESTLELEEESEQSAIEEINYEEYGIKFPLPPQGDESLCRDEYLKKLFEPIDQNEITSRRTLPSEIYSRRSRRTGTIGAYGNAEAMAIHRMIKRKGKAVEFQEPTEFKVTLSAAEKQIIFKKFIVQFRKDAFEYLAVRLKRRLEIFVNIWPGEHIPYNLFHWSVEHFVTRSRISQLYLQVLAIERSEMSLNCAKFCRDVNEIIRLLDAIRQDIRLDEDLCKGAMKLMNDANYDKSAKWILSLEDDRALRSKLALQVFSQYGKRETPLHDSLLVAQSRRHDVYMPIELRYRIKCIHSSGEQHLMWLQHKEKVRQDELEQLNNQIKEDSLAFEFREYVTNFQIDSYRVSIAKWEEQLEIDMEDIELKCSIKRNLYIKAKDDLKFYKEQVEMFKKRVAQVLEQEEEEEQAKHLQNYRRGTKISLASLRKKKRKTKNRDSKKKWST
ncbi:uncharacterized protein LOC117781592 [Drosophila innubila]|uniref:uncharacterized protein LOC117781592 n=1 Tax=Drosophila innubila TaxID=198719 RepID=UPI00148D6AB3|nr:uncharacterized protein LOC117781592 [Drosophila innubila]